MLLLNVKAAIAPFAILGMVVDTAVVPMSAENFMQYALTQGGLFGVVLIGGYVWRRDAMKALADKTERIDVLTTLVANSVTASTQAAASMAEATAAIRAQASSIQNLSMIIQRLDVGLGGRRSGDQLATP
jgi:hypothetical protein